MRQKTIKVRGNTYRVPVDDDGLVPMEYIQEVQSKRSARSRATDGRRRAKTTFPQRPQPEQAVLWKINPGKYDIEGIDTPLVVTLEEKPSGPLQDIPDDKGIYYPIHEETARLAHENAHFGRYTHGTATGEYRRKVDEVYALAESLKANAGKGRWEEIDGYAETFARRLADWTNRRNANFASCPSVMVSGSSNYPKKKQERMVAADDRLRQEYSDIMDIPDRMREVANRALTARDVGSEDKMSGNISKLEADQEYMKGANAYFRKNKTLVGYEGMGPGADKLFAENIRIHGKPFPDYMLSSNREKIKRLKKNLSTIEDAQDSGFSQRTVGDMTITEDPSKMLITIAFPDKPEQDVISVLKSNGFRWSPKAKVWQRTLDDTGRKKADAVVKAIYKPVKPKKTKESDPGRGYSASTWKKKVDFDEDPEAATREAMKLLRAETVEPTEEMRAYLEDSRYDEFGSTRYRYDDRDLVNDFYSKKWDEFRMNEMSYMNRKPRKVRR